MKPQKPKNPANNTNPPTIDPSEWFKKDEAIVLTNRKSFLPTSRKSYLAITTVLILVGVTAASFAMKSLGTEQATVSTDTTQTTAQPTSDNDTASQETVTATPAPVVAEPTPAAPSTPKPATPAPVANTPAPVPAPAPKPTVVTHTMNYTTSCYSPKNITVNKGDIINFVNTTTSRDMWPASDNHPSHTLYSEFDADRGFDPGTTYSFTFTKTGSWGYHDHLRSSCEGTVTVI